jgi:hypothetical protein
VWICYHSLMGEDQGGREKLKHGVNSFPPTLALHHEGGGNRTTPLEDSGRATRPVRVAINFG